MTNETNIFPKLKLFKLHSAADIVESKLPTRFDTFKKTLKLKKRGASWCGKSPLSNSKGQTIHIMKKDDQYVFYDFSTNTGGNMEQLYSAIKAYKYKY